ncbi:MAG: hypothetical protein LQ351_002892 [Letrouitia transgressa]|nr:MAG: hypothetical protein LQ351_002892 [Letrouitia transgressa]
MVHYYIDHYLAQYPFISESKIFGSLEALRMGHGDAVDHWTAFLILAVALASKSSSQNGSKYKEAVTYLVTALRYAEIVLLPGSIQAVQMVLLLVQYSLVDPYHFEVWYLIGAAARIAIDLGLHQDLPQTVQLKNSQLDLRRRVYHSVYALDRTASMSYRRSFTFSDNSANVARFKTAISPAAAGYVLRLREIQSSFYMKLFRSGSNSIQNTWPIICSAIDELRQWEEGLPQQLQPEALRGMLQIETLFTKILFLSPPRATKRLPDHCRFLMLQYVTEYAMSVSSITSNSEAAEFLNWINALQTLFVADMFFRLLEQHAVLLFADVTPDPPNALQAGTFPPLRLNNSGQDKLVDALESCQLLDSAVEYLGTKFEYSRPFTEYRTKSVYACSILQKFDSQWNPS